MVSKRRKRHPIVTSVEFSSFSTSDSGNLAAISGDGRSLLAIGRMGNSFAHAVEVAGLEPHEQSRLAGMPMLQTDYVTARILHSLHSIRSLLALICAQHPEHFALGLIELLKSNRPDKIVANMDVLGLDHAQWRVFSAAGQSCKAGQPCFIPLGL